MVKVQQWIHRHLPTQRRLIQLYAALLYNAHVKGFIRGNIYTGHLKFMCVPGLNCYSCPGAVGACPLGALQNAIASSGSRMPAYILGILLLYGLMLGRTICGFLCPVGLIQELLHKLPTPKLQKNRFTRACSYLKYAILLVFVLFIPLCYMGHELPLPAFCKYICPAGTFEGAVGLLSHPENADKFSMLGQLFTNKFVLMMLVGAACVFVYRAFCRFFCPLGAIYGLFSKVAFIGVKVENASCVDCGKCIRRCPMDIHHVGDHECIHCGACIDACPTGAISFKAGKYTIQSSTASHQSKDSAVIRRNRNTVWTIAIMILLVLLLWSNLDKSPRDVMIPPTTKTETADSVKQLPTGKDVGMLAPDFTVPVYGEGKPFTLSQHRGKIVIINFWATWCTPCVKELPYFDEIQRMYGDAVQVVAIHSNLVTEAVESYLSRNDYDIAFALDAENTVIPAYGGSMMLPQTIIVDSDGVIAYNAVGSLTMERLQQLLTNMLY